MVAFGTTCLLLATLAAVWAAAASFLGGALRSTGFVISGRRAVYAAGLFFTIAIGSLEYLILTNDFSVEYVFQNSHITQPLFFKIGALWGGQAGSLLFWAWILSIYAVVLAFWNRHRHKELMPFATGVLMSTLVFFGIVLSLVTPPFRPGVAHADGMGMNPLLQNYWMVIHPPCLYLGYVGFAVPFAFGVAAMITRRTGEVWIRTTRRWTIFAWFFLGIGILLGAYWAYIELGWGGYWAWDPVETASFMPWLVGTAFLHSVLVQEQKRMLKVWNLVLVILTYCLAIFGTFLTRSGILQSVHAFAGTGLGPYFAVYLGIALFGSLGLLIWRLPDLRSEHRLDSLLSRESAFLLNNLLLVGITGAVFFLTIFPIPSELWTGKGITMGPPIYNRVTLPWFLALIFLTGIGPLVAWRKASPGSLRRMFLAPTLAAAGMTVVLFASGVREFYPLAFYASAIFVFGSIVSEFARGAAARMRTKGEGAAIALSRLIWRSKRRYGGYVVHLGIVLAVIGIAGSSAYKKDATFEDVRPGKVMTLDGYDVRYERIEAVEGTAYTRVTLYTRLSRAGRDLGPMVVEKRIYKDVKNPTTEVAIVPFVRPASLADIRRIGEDVYLTPISMDPDSGIASFTVHVLPFVNWLWLGGLVVILGTSIAIFPDRNEKRLMAHSGPSKSARLRSGPFFMRLVVPAAVLVCGLLAHGRAAGHDASPEAPEKIKVEYEKVADEVLCYCGCARQTVHECTCSVAMDLRTDWERRLASGETADMLIAGYVAEHGEQSRNAPPRKGLNLLAWFGPGIAIALAATATMVVIAVWAARGRRAREAAAAGGTIEAPAGDVEVRQRLERELGEFDP